MKSRGRCLLNMDQKQTPTDSNAQVSPDRPADQTGHPAPAVHTFSRSQNGQPKKRIYRVIIPAILLVAAIIVVLLCTRGSGDLPVTTDPALPVIGGGEPIPGEQGKPKDSGNSHLPAYDRLTFSAGKKEQNLVLQNPGENACLIRFSLILEDGTTVYQSELVEPGYYTRPITLLKPMEPGIYERVTLKYECFTNDSEHTPLNGATSKLTVIVE